MDGGDGAAGDVLEGAAVEGHLGPIKLGALRDLVGVRRSVL